jgi:hypothetical protein
MRTPLLLWILVAATAGACNQSLTGNMTGTGGFATGTGDTGGVIFGTGDTGGTSLGTGGAAGYAGAAALCDTLSAEYFSAIAAAGSCQVGVSGQCQRIVKTALSGCSCQTYVTDVSALSAIETAWQAAGCAASAEPPCTILCPAALNTVCVPTDGGSTGYCSYVPGTGGTGGTGGGNADAGLSACDKLEAEYAAVITGAKSCTATAGNQCAQSVLSSLSACGPCTEYVNDRTVLDAIRQAWDADGCGKGPVNCPVLPPCSGPGLGICLPSDAGGSVCGSGGVP